MRAIVLMGIFTIIMVTMSVAGIYEIVANHNMKFAIPVNFTSIAGVIGLLTTTTMLFRYYKK